MPSTSERDTLVYRFSSMLIKLNNGDKLHPKMLADEFGVSVRTIQRDLNDRFAYLPLIREEGAYRLDPGYLGKFSRGDIERFASLAGVKGLFPSLTTQFLRQIFDMQVSTSIQVIGHNYEDITSKEAVFALIEKAINDSVNICFSYEKSGDKSVDYELSPYKIVNSKGIWYVCGECDAVIKSFQLTRMAGIRAGRAYKKQARIHKTISEGDSIWFSENLTTVTFRVSADVAKYFNRRKLVPNQKILETSTAGKIVVSSDVAHEDQILPVLRYWLPHISVISPQEIKSALTDSLVNYLNDNAGSNT